MTARVDQLQKIGDDPCYEGFAFSDESDRSVGNGVREDGVDPVDADQLSWTARPLAEPPRALTRRYRPATR